MKVVYMTLAGGALNATVEVSERVAAELRRSGGVMAAELVVQDVLFPDHRFAATELRVRFVREDREIHALTIRR